MITLLYFVNLRRITDSNDDTSNVMVGSGWFRSVLVGSGRFWSVLVGSGWFRLVPVGSGRFRSVLVGSGPLVNRRRYGDDLFLQDNSLFIVEPYVHALFDIILFLDPLHEKTCAQYIKEEGKGGGGSGWVYNGKYPLLAHPMVPATGWGCEGSGRGELE